MTQLPNLPELSFYLLRDEENGLYERLPVIKA